MGGRKPPFVADRFLYTHLDFQRKRVAEAPGMNISF